MMDVETLRKMGAQVDRIEVQYSRKIGDYGSVGGSMMLAAAVSPESDPSAVARAMFEYAKELAKAGLEESFAAVRREVEARAQAQQAVAPPPAQIAPPAPIPPPMPVPPPAQPPPPAGEPTDEYVRLENPSCAHVLTQNGEDSFKVFGGKWSKWGVVAWPEVLAEAGIVGWEQWPVCKAGKNGFETEHRYSLPNGLKAALVLIDKGGTPLKVTAFR